jgi:hypothetical protein
MLIDPHTGLLKGGFQGSFGSIFATWAYDRELGMLGHLSHNFSYCISSGGWGMHYIWEFDESIRRLMENIYGERPISSNTEWNIALVQETSRGLLLVESVDYTAKEYTEDSWPSRTYTPWRIPPWGRHGLFALMYNKELITDFIFHQGLSGGPFGGSQIRGNIVAVRRYDYWGIMTSAAETLVPFKFEHIFLIDEYTAFARYNGRYGILYLRYFQPV